MDNQSCDRYFLQMVSYLFKIIITYYPIDKIFPFKEYKEIYSFTTILRYIKFFIYFKVFF